MIRAFSTLGCVDASLDELFNLARRFDCALEFRGLAGRLDVPTALEEICGTPEEFASRVRAAGVRVASLDTSFRFFAAAEADRTELLRYVPWAEALGGVRLRVFDGGKTLDAPTLAAGVKEWQWWAAQRAEHGWKSDVMIETHDALVSAAPIQEWLAAAPDAGILWDAQHTWRKGGEDPLRTWRAIRDSVVHVHVKDSVSRPSERHPFTYVLPGDGEFPMAALRRQLQADGYTGPISLEWERHWHPELAPIEHALSAATDRNWW